MNIKRLVFLALASFFLLVERILMEFETIATNYSFSLFMEVQLFVLYLYVCIMAVRRLGMFNIFTLFLFTLGLFNFMKIFYGLFMPDSYRNVYSMIEIDLTEEIVQEVLWVYTLFTVVLYTSYMHFNEKIKQKLDFHPRKRKWMNIQEWSFSNDPKMFRIGRVVMLSTLAFVLYRCYIEVTFLGGASFTEIYVGGSQSIPIPSYVRILSVFFQVGFMMVLGSRPTRSSFFKYSTLYLITILPNLAMGLRNAFAMTLLFFLWYFIKVYQPKIRIWTILIPALLIIVLLQIVALNRDDEEISTAILMLIPLFLTYQSTSMYVLSLYVQYKEAIMAGPYPYILDPLIGWMTGADGQSLEVLERRSSLGHQLVYSISPDAYLSGRSFGSTCVAELYQFGAIGIILGAILLAWFILKFDVGIKQHRMYLLFSMFFCSYIFLAPRNTFFPSLYFFLRYVVVYMLIMFIWQAIETKLKKGRQRKTQAGLAHD